LTQPSLSWSLSAPLSGYLKESLVTDYAADAAEPSARLNASYATNFTLTNKWVNYQKTKPTHLMQSRLSYDFSRRISHLEDSGTAYAGVSANRLGLGLDYFAGNLLRLQTSTAYNYLEKYSNWRQNLDPVSLTGNLSMSPYSLTWQSQYQWMFGKFTSGYLSAATYGGKWNVALNTSYSYQGSASSASTLSDFREYSVYGSLNGTYRAGLGFSLRSSAQYDFSRNRLNNISFGILRDLHCWELQAGYSRYLSSLGDRNEFGIGINLKAFPAFRAGTPGAGGFSAGE